MQQKDTIAIETAKLNLGEDTNDDTDPLARDVEADLEEDEVVLEDSQPSQLYLDTTLCTHKL